jgi:NTP pyrophosphatase (non-canonical NTP hydrolase)
MESLSEYQDLAMRTAKPLSTRDNLVHAVMGLSGEAGEFADCIKKSLIYGQPLNHANAMEELGDILWFVALACKTLEVPMTHVAQMNVDKLATRYPEKYSDALAAQRLDKE